jgi:hypothetical protein
MANGNSHPFNSDVIAVDLIVQSQNQLSHQEQQNVQKYRQDKDLIDLLCRNNTNDQLLHSSDSSFTITLHSVSDDDFNRLKHLIRSVIWPLNDSIRRQLWMNILTLDRITSSKQPRPANQTSQTTLSVIIDNNLNSLSSKYNQWPKFVDTNNLCFYHLTESTGHSLLQRVLLAFALHHPDVTYCPALEPFSALLLHYHNEKEVLYLLNRLLIKNWLYGGTYLQWEANCNVFKELLRLYYVRSIQSEVYKNIFLSFRNPQLL